MSGGFIAVEKLFGKRSQCFYSLGVKPIHEKRKEERKNEKERQEKEKEKRHPTFCTMGIFLLEGLICQFPFTSMHTLNYVTQGEERMVL